MIIEKKPKKIKKVYIKDKEGDISKVPLYKFTNGITGFHRGWISSDVFSSKDLREIADYLDKINKKVRN